MRARAAALALIGCIASAGCAGGVARPKVEAKVPASWRAVVTAEDRDRLRKWRDAWVDALGQVRVAGGSLAAYGALLESDRALATPLPPAGDYRCRTIKLGARMDGMAKLNPYPWFTCRIEREGAVLSFVKDTGSQRPAGLIFDDGPSRGIFLGTLMLADESTPLDYGQDRARDMAGIVERVGDRRWRIALPYPAFESTLDVVELVPAG